MKQIILFPIGALTEEERSALILADYLPITVPDPSAVVLPVPVADLGRDRLLLIALEALGTNPTQEVMQAKSRFVDGLVVLLREREKEKKQSNSQKP